MIGSTMQLPESPKLGFVVGFPRSGTTLLTAKLGSYVGIAATPETRFFEEFVALTWKPQEQLSAQKLLKEISIRRRIHDLNIDFDALLSAAPSMTRVALFGLLMAEFGNLRGAEVVVEKSPIHAYHLTDLARWYPEAKFIGIVRDGRDALLSLERTPWADWPTWKYAADWRMRNTLIIRAKQAYPDRVQIVHFEDLVSGNSSVAQDLAEWLLGHSALRATDNAASVVPQWELEWKGKALAKDDPARAGGWRAEESRYSTRLMESVSGGLLQDLGYESSPSTLGGEFVYRWFQVYQVVRWWGKRFLTSTGAIRKLRSDKKLEALIKGAD